jgi:creatinine amidohydrolase/Fe(II)-dependent formamide hydrolase-like protein
MALGLGVSMPCGPVLAQSVRPLPSVHLEELTWTEVRDALAAGSTTALIYAGSTEQNGPHLVLGKHNFIAHHVAGRIAAHLGNAIAYPVLPYAPTGDSAARSGHMRFPGSITLTQDTFARVVREVAVSALASGFRHVVLMGDHGDGQRELGQVADELDAVWRLRGARVFHVPEVYALQGAQVQAHLARLGIAHDGHGAVADTAELMAIDAQGRWVRTGAWARTADRSEAATGVSGDPSPADVALGRIFIDLKVDNGVRRIQGPDRGGTTLTWPGPTLSSRPDEPGPNGSRSCVTSSPSRAAPSGGRPWRRRRWDCCSWRWPPAERRR